jgi:hypothetical protein
MSIAAVQRHLAVSSLGDVAVRPYFVQLCESLAVSMIPDPNVLSIEVTGDDSVVAANKSVTFTQDDARQILSKSEAASSRRCYGLRLRPQSDERLASPA